MNLIFIKDFNNYFDRIVKNHNYINDYIKDREYQIVENVNFEEKNRIDTTHIVNWKNNWVPNYMLAVEGETILSKWFVLEWDKIRGRQFKAILKGDVIAMNLEQIKDSPIFVEKAVLNLGDPLLYNSENGSYNQIKQKETLLKDNTKIGWLVGYYAQDDKNEGKDRIVDGRFSHIEGNDPIEDISSIKKGVYLNFGDSERPTYSDLDFDLELNVRSANGIEGRYYNHPYIAHFKDGGFDSNKGLISTQERTYGSSFYTYEFKEEIIRNNVLRCVTYDSLSFIDTFKNLFFDDTNYFRDDKYIKSLHNKLIRKDGQVYQITVETISEKQEVIINEENELTTTYRKLFHKYFGAQMYGAKDNYGYKSPTYRVYFTGYRYVVRCIPTESSIENVRIVISNKRNHLNDAPYDMFCVPYDLTNNSNNEFETKVDTKIKINNLLTLASIRSIIEQLGGTGTNKFLYDLQYLPYCPIEEIRKTYYDGIFHLKDIDGFKEGVDYDIINRTDGLPEPVITEPIGFIAWATKSSGTLNISVDIKVSDNNIERKIENETKLVRLVSPNYNGIFEFSPSKNNGVHYINVDYTYKPFAPYLHLNPDFSGLYGKDFNDDRGLIVGGDFSIPAISDNFINYALNNKNYQEIFNREIKHMDFTHNINIEQQQIATGVNALSGVIGGATAGAMAGGLPGAIAGGVVGGVGSAIGGVADIHYANIQHREDKAFRKDMFTFQLGNIKAQPQSISKTTPFTFNNKIFPFIEEYDATEQEKESLRLKIKYNGMNVSKVDKLLNYIHEDEKLFFKGQLIRVNNLGDDYNMACAIYSELDKGVYM